MMRSMFSGVAGLRTHQSKMDVIGNNIANVNTVGYKTQNVTFTDVFYQTVQAASGPNAETGKGGTNAKQIGIGSALGTIATNVSKQGGMQATDNPFDVMINGDEFFIVSDGQSNYFTKAGNFNVDEAGNLVNGSGMTVMGWQVNDAGEIVKSRVTALKVMGGDKSSASPAKTTNSNIFGNLNQKDDQFGLSNPKDCYVPFTAEFYDSQGYLYNATFHIKKLQDGTNGDYYATFLYSITDQNGDVVSQAQEVEDANKTKVYQYLNDNKALNTMRFNNTTDTIVTERDSDKTTVRIAPGQIFSLKGDITTQGLTPEAPEAVNGTYTGNFEIEIPDISKCMEGGWNKDKTEVDPATLPLALKSQKITIDFAQLTNYGTQATTSTIESKRGDSNGLGAGKAAGTLSSLAISDDGKVVGNYTNGDIITLGQIAVTSFANPAGLEKLGNNLFGATMNSGSFDGIGKDITANGDSMTTGVLEMSNVDLAYEFTEMITTQRGFQANSRIITTSDTMLEELINLKR